ncbi:MAG: hypothetical protein VX038_01160 [Verrucomicrobiota bacterium]|nr:hypothetical protein [Verrucomicrobiota bacterium]
MSNQSMTASPIEALKGGFRRACVRRLVGDEQGAVAVLRDEIPKLVISWSKTTSLEASEKKAKLKEIFDDESTRADELATAFDLFAARFERRVAGIVTREIKNACVNLEKATQSLLANSHELLEPNANNQSSSGSSGPLVEKTTDSQKEKVIKENVESKIVAKEQADEVSEFEADCLDEPLGLGLKFDEIEEMIDQVLSMQN